MANTTFQADRIMPEPVNRVYEAARAETDIVSAKYLGNGCYEITATFQLSTEEIPND